MEKTYSPQHIEQKWYQIWEAAGYFAPRSNGCAKNAPPYCIVIPPPNVTGSLHMGHGFQLSIMDALIRYKRMQGYNTLWQTGTDHAGIATQIVVEQQLGQHNTTRHTLGRDTFVAKVWEWKQLSGDTICQQQRRLGISVDWQRQRFTLDPGLAAAVQKVFISLYDEGLIYRGKRLVNWDPALNTAVSDLEVNNEEQDGHLWYIKYPQHNSKGEFIVIATTRPETILGDVAVAVHPDDTRYQHLIGKKLELPLTKRLIPIIADPEVDREFGSGCVKITPAHDFNDYAMGQRHNLPLLNIFTPQAQLNENVPESYRGLDRFVARTKIVAKLDALGLLLKIEPHRISIPKGERSGAIVEPYLTDQWFVKTQELAAPAIAAVKNGKIKFIPENWDKTYFQWLENIQDWCISRQLWWGHRIPAWYDATGKIYVGESIAAICKKYKLDATKIALTQDEDVLDTWFSSALWPFSSLGWPDKTPDLQTFYPTSVLITGFDIIFFWVARMIMMGLKFTGKVPFSEIYITGLIRDSKGKKMSKSKGNVIDPVDLIDGISLDALIAKRTSNLMQQSLKQNIIKTTRLDFPKGIQAFGADALRFTFCALAATGRDINFDFGRLEGYRNFCTKLWNAARYVLMTFAAEAQSADTPKKVTAELGTPEKWINTKLQQTLKKVSENFLEYRFDLIAQTIYEFIWHEFCDWYVEFSKVTLTSDNNASSAQKNGTRQTLVTILETTLRLIHPLMPFISEEIWQQIAPFAGTVKPNSTKPISIMLQQYPVYQEKTINEEALQEIAWLKKIILAVRNIRGEMNIAPKKLLQLFITKGNASDEKFLAKNKVFLLNLAKLENVVLDNTRDFTKTFSATAVVDNLELRIPIGNIIDKSAEVWRLNKEINRLKADLEKLAHKLKNDDYRTKAPADILAKEQQRLNETTGTLEKLTKNLALVENL